MTPPTYPFLMAEYVSTLECLLEFKTIPDDIRERMKQRAKLLKAQKLTDEEIDVIVKELLRMKNFRSKLPNNVDYFEALEESVLTKQTT